MIMNEKWDIHLKTCAKVNLGLKVNYKRKDGYHEIETLFLPITLFDEIYVKKISNGLEIICSDTSIPCNETNLAGIAFLKLKERYSSKIKDGVRIFIEKKIPVGAGLGGGSSDAG